MKKYENMKPAGSIALENNGIVKINQRSDLYHPGQESANVFSTKKNMVLQVEEKIDLVKALRFLPSASIIMPFRPTMVSKAILELRLHNMFRQVEEKLLKEYTSETSRLLLDRLQEVFKEINFATDKKSLAIFVSPIFQKILYLNFEVHAIVSVSHSFSIRNILACKKVNADCAVLVLQQGSRYIYAVEDGSWSQYFAHNRCGEPEDFSGCHKCSKYNFNLTDNLLDYFSENLRIPILVAGSQESLRAFRSKSRHARQVVKFFLTSEEDQPLENLQETVSGYLNDKECFKSQKLSVLLAEAKQTGKLFTGLRQVSSAKLSGKRSILLVEKNFWSYEDPDSFYCTTLNSPMGRFTYLQDCVDNVIEKVLTHEGDVELVDAGFLGDEHIALLT